MGTVLVAILQLMPVTALPWRCYFCFTSPSCWISCFGKGRRLEIDPQQAIEDTLASGEILTQNHELWQDTLDLLADNAVETQEDLERLVFEGTQEENEKIGLLEEVVLVAAIWERVEEHIDTNDDRFLTAEEWSTVNLSDIPLPSTSDDFKALLTQEDLERLVFEGTQEGNEKIGLLEEVVLVAAIWERVEEHIDTNDDRFLTAEEWSTV